MKRQLMLVITVSCCIVSANAQPVYPKQTYQERLAEVQMASLVRPSAIVILNTVLPAACLPHIEGHFDIREMEITKDSARILALTGSDKYGAVILISGNKRKLKKQLRRFECKKPEGYFINAS